MKHCCEGKGEALRSLRHRQRRMLITVLSINLGMFFIEAGAGLMSRSSALMADSLDMFGDAVVYGVTLYALDRGTGWHARSSILKGFIMLAFAVSVVLEAAYKAATGVVPEAHTMGGIGAVALVANGCCLLLLLRHRRDDINMTSAWICSRNDMIANISVIVAAFSVAFTRSAWPDVLVGAGIATLLLISSMGILRDGFIALRSSRQPVAPSPER
ncbi:MAG TPA: cation transporter [Polyangiaceae bacterium]